MQSHPSQVGRYSLTSKTGNDPSQVNCKLVYNSGPLGVQLRPRNLLLADGPILLVHFAYRDLHDFNCAWEHLELFRIVADFSGSVQPSPDPATEVNKEHSDMRIFKNVSKTSERSASHVVREDQTLFVEDSDCGRCISPTPCNWRRIPPSCYSSR